MHAKVALQLYNAVLPVTRPLIQSSLTNDVIAEFCIVVMQESRILQQDLDGVHSLCAGATAHDLITLHAQT